MAKKIPSALKRHKKMISDFYRDSDGCWVELKKGFSNFGEHSIHEDTWKDCAESIKFFVEKCNCNQCK